MNNSFQQEDSQKFVDHLSQLGLVVIDKKALEDILFELKVKALIPLKNKWLTRKEVKAKYNISRYWLDQRALDPKTLLKVDVGDTCKSTIKYNEQSIIDEQDRLGV